MLRHDCERMQATVLGRRLRLELLRPVNGSGPEALWMQRFHLSRLQAQYRALNLAHEPEPGDAAHIEDADDWLIAVMRRRAELAAAVDKLVSDLPSSDRHEPSKRIVQAAFDEVGETIAFLEEMSLRRAVTRLELVQEDLERIGSSVSRWIGSNHREARRVDRLMGQVRGEWQEKLLARRMESLFGHRFVAILENAVLILILALFAMIAAEAVVRRLSPRGLSAREHLFFAWADLAICSVFLFEFVLKLTLAPNRFSYFMRHLLIDFVASLPFGFVAHQIDLDQMESVLGSGSRLAILPRLGNSAGVRVLRFRRSGVKELKGMGRAVGPHFLVAKVHWCRAATLGESRDRGRVCPPSAHGEQ